MLSYQANTSNIFYTNFQGKKSSIFKGKPCKYQEKAYFSDGNIPFFRKETTERRTDTVASAVLPQTKPLARCLAWAHQILLFSTPQPITSSNFLGKSSPR